MRNVTAEESLNRPTASVAADTVKWPWPTVFFFGLGALYYCRGLHWFTAWPGDIGDSRLNSVLLEHVYRWVTTGGGTLWSPTFFYPFENVLAFSDNHFGTAWIYVTLRFLGLDREHSFMYWFLTGTVLNYAAAHYVIRRLGFSVFAAAAGAFIFTFAMPVLAQDGHAQLVYRFAIPLGFLAYWNFTKTLRIYYLFVFFIALCMQFFCSVYIGVFMVYLIFAYSVALAYANLTAKSVLKQSDCQQCAKWRTYSAAATAAFFIVLLLLMLLKYKAVASDYGFGRGYPEIKSMLPRFSSYLLADSSRISAWVGRWVSDIPMRHEHQMFVGLGVLTLATIGILGMRSRKSTASVIKLSGLALLLLVSGTLVVDALSPANSLYRLIAGLPGVNSLRAVARIILVMLFPVALLAANGIEAVQARVAACAPWARFAVSCALALSLSAETVLFQGSSTPIAEVQWRNNQFRALIREPLPEDAIIFLTPKTAESWLVTEIDSIVLAQDVDRPTLNGYSGNTPPGYQRLTPCQPPNQRLENYVRFRHLPHISTNLLARRVIRVSPDACD